MCKIFIQALITLCFTATALFCGGLVQAEHRQIEKPVSKQAIVTAAAPAARGPYSQAIRYGDLLFLAGQMAFDPKSGSFLGSLDIEGQTRQVMENLKAVLAANGLTMDHILSSTVYLADMGDFARMNKVYGEYFSKDPPARATSGATLLFKEARIEISAIAGK